MNWECSPRWQLCRTAPRQSSIQFATAERGEEILRPLSTFATPIADQTQIMPYTAVQSIVESFNPRGLRNYWKMVYLKEMSEDAIRFMTEMYARVPAQPSHVVIYTLGGALSRVPASETAAAHRDARHGVIAIGMWEDAAADDINIQWVQDFVAGMQPFASGGLYPNYDEAARWRRARGGVRTRKIPAPRSHQANLRSGEHFPPESKHQTFRLNRNITGAEVGMRPKKTMSRLGHHGERSAPW